MRRRAHGDDGVYAILYALLVLVLFATAALVVDISSMRESRRDVRSATDSAALAGASRLNLIDPSKSFPQEACRRVWKYLHDSLGIPEAAAQCGLPLPLDSSTCPNAPVAVPVVTTGNYKVKITWPVEDGNYLLTNPDVAPSDVTQAADENFDGANDIRCARIGVEVVQKIDFTFGAAIGVANASTRSASVARAVKQGDGKPVIGALNILEPHRCQALYVHGQGSLAVGGSGTAAGVIAIESDGHDSRSGSGTRCPSSAPYVLDIDNANTGNNFVRVDGPAGPGKGVLEQYALWSGSIGNVNDAYEKQDLTQGTPVRLAPKPTVLETPTGAKPVTDKYDCTAARGCTVDLSANYVSNLVTAYGSNPIANYLGSGTTYGTMPFKTLPGDPSVPGFACNMQSSDPTVVVPAGNWHVTCSSLKVGNKLVFQGGNIVADGEIELGSNGSCLAVNVPIGTGSCPTANTTVVPKTTNPPPTGDSVLYIRSGRLYKTGQASLFLPQTFVYLGNGYVDLGGGGTGSLLWTTPLGLDCAGAEPCLRARFVRLCLWSENSGVHSIGGQAGLQVRGVFFIPNAPFTYTGQGNQDMKDAQFWVKTMEIGGQGTLTMAADPTAAIERFTSGVALIR